MLPAMERPNDILKSEFVNIQAFHISLKKDKDWQQQTNYHPKTPLML